MLAFIIAVFLGGFITDFLGYGYNVFSDPFDPILLTINIVTYIVLATVIDLILKKWNQNKSA
ncbi:hypothetical protein HC752_07960 [Vibrio sp. S9_S30]|uniref:hypothetical protein n=1 Tax=Vibrio sp. S9_S30 TaxID=2720226 RepID=UPI001680ECF0|nr:hypothetical protein [Vibrio sp. S9_S30]MBD1556869.1 hypothetical protein [Vibrio sp. S9_S30]